MTETGKGGGKKEGRKEEGREGGREEGERVINSSTYVDLL